MNYGHWKTLKEVDINDYIGFVYVIEFSNKTRYIGAKKIWKKIKQAPSTFKRKSGFIQSDWKTYTSSSSEVNDNIEKGIYPSNYIIVGFYKTWGATLFAEAMMQLSNNVLGDNMWLNKHIEGHFTFSCLDDNIERDIKRWKDYVSGKIKVKEYKSSETIYDIKSGKVLELDNIFSFCSQKNINSDTFERLINGDIDDIRGIWSLVPEKRRKVNEYLYEDKEYPKAKDVMTLLSVDRKVFNSMVKDGIITKLETEDRNEYKLRIKNG